MADGKLRVLVFDNLEAKVGDAQLEISDGSAEEIATLFFKNWLDQNEKEPYLSDDVMAALHSGMNKDKIQSRLRDGYLIYLINPENKIVGAAMLRKNKYEEYELYTLNVRTDYRGLGLGKFMTTARLNRVVELGAAEVVLDAFLWPSTQRYHHDRGFIKVDRPARWPEIAITMRKDLADYEPPTDQTFQKTFLS